tara:strand:+ start:79 stop:267 length:189 start_codon:yes stop_codon:yes gene_type:complete
VVKSNAIPDGWMGLDQGPDANVEIAEELRSCKTVIWNGPMGVFEMEVSERRNGHRHNGYIHY